MTFPGFSAAAALDPARQGYTRASRGAGARANDVRPQLIGDVPRCRYVRDCYEVCNSAGECKEKCFRRYVCD